MGSFQKKRELFRFFILVFVTLGLVSPLRAGESSIQKAEIRLLKKMGKKFKITVGKKSGLICQVKNITLAEPFSNYNPSIVPFKDGYLLSFRHDIPDPNSRTKAKRRSLIGLLRLDSNFNHTEPPTYLDTGYRDCEDARLFYVGDSLHLCCCIFFPEQWSTNIGVGSIDSENLRISKLTLLHYSGAQPIEKNWTPLVYSTAPNDQRLYFIYSFVPHTILETRRSQQANAFVSQETVPTQEASIGSQLHAWEERWGAIHGGTPALKMGNEYISFFHSRFTMSGQICYVMGAMILEGTPPFRVTAISKKPILFKKMYASPRYPEYPFAVPANVHVIFPAGITEGVFGGKSVFHISYGDNDNGIGIVTIDKMNLLASLTKISS